MERTASTELIPGLPEAIGLECLTRLPYTAHRFASRVCQRWSRLLLSKEFYYHRRKCGYIHKVACLVQARKAVSTDRVKPDGSPNYGITVFDSVSHSWQRLDPVPEYPNGLPLFCQLESCEGKLVVMGGWDPDSYNPITDVWVYDFATQRWARGKDMPSKRSFFAIGAFEGRVYVAGGHDENKNALRTGCVYDLCGNEWSELPQLIQERDECEGVVIGEEFWVLSGYGTESQGQFDGSADVYGFNSGQWRQVEGVWEPGRCPRTCVGVGKDGQLVNWAELDPAVRVGICGVTLGSRALVTGSGYQGGPHGFYMIEIKRGQNSKLENIDVPDVFCGFVQSGCSVEI